MNNFLYAQKGMQGGGIYQIKDPIDLNRNFTNSYMSNQIFIKKDSSVSSQSYLEGKTDYTGIDIPTSPNASKETLHNFNYKLEYERLLAKSKKKQEKFKKVLIEFQNQVMIKDSIVTGLQKQLQRIRNEPEGVTSRELNKAKDMIKQYELLLDKSEKTRKETEYELDKSRKIIFNLQEQIKEKTSQSLYESTKPKQYYVAKLIQCQNALREREQRCQKLNSDLVHSRSQLDYAQKSTVQDDKISLIKALNAKRLIQDQLNKTVIRLSSELTQMRDKYNSSQQSKSRLEYKLAQTLKKTNQLISSQNQSHFSQSKLKQMQLSVSQLSDKNCKKQQEIMNLKTTMQKLTSGSILQTKQLNQTINELNLQKQKYSLVLAEKQVTELKYKEQKLNFTVKLENEQKEIQVIKGQLKDSILKLQNLRGQYNKQQVFKQQIENQLKEKQNRIKQISEQHRKQMIRIREQNKHMTGLINKLNQQISNKNQLYKSIDRLKQENKQLNDNILELTNQLNDQKDTQSGLSCKIVQLQNQIKSLKIQVKQTDSNRTETQKTICELELRNLKQQQQIQTINTNNTSLQQQITKISQRGKELEEENNNLKVKIDLLSKQKDLEIKKGVALNESIFTVLKEKKGAEQSVTKIQSALQLSQDRLFKKDQQIQLLKSTISSLNQIESQLKNSYTFSESQILDLSQTNNSLKNTEHQLRNQLADKQLQLSNKTEQFKLFAEKLEVLIVKLEQIQEENEILQSDNNTLTNRIYELQQSNKYKQQQSITIKTEYQDIMEKLKEKEQIISNDIKSFKHLCQQKENQKNELEDKVEILENTLKKLKQQSEQNAIRLSEELIQASKAQESIQVKFSHSSKLLHEQQGKRKQVQKQLKNVKGVRSQHQTIVKSLKMQLQSALNSNRESLRKVQQYKKQKIQLTSTVSSLRQQVKSLKKVQKSKIKDRKTQQKQKPSKNQQKLKLQKSKSKTDTELTQLKQTLEKYRTNQDLLKKQILELKQTYCSQKQTQILAIKQKQILLESKQQEIKKMLVGEEEYIKIIEEEKRANDDLIRNIKDKEQLIKQLESQRSSLKILISQANNQNQQDTLGQMKSNLIDLQNRNLDLQKQVFAHRNLLTHYKMKQLVVQIIDETSTKLLPKVQNIKQDRTVSVEKHIIQLINKIEWMEQNLNFINQQNNDLQIQLDQKDNVIFDIRKALEKNQMTIRDMKGHIDKNNRKILRNQELISILNKELIGLQFKYGNDKYTQNQNYQQAKYQGQKQLMDSCYSIQDNVKQSLDIQQQ